MPTWYHRASWGLARAFWAGRLIERYAVEARFEEDLPEAPFVLMADHSHALDPYVIGALVRQPLHYMANIEGVSPLAAALASLVGAYGKRKAKADIAALRRTIGLVGSGEAVGIFPEGDRSWDGASDIPRPGTGRLVKRLGVPLVLVRQKGNYLTRPRWAARPRSGRWSLDFSVIPTREIARLDAPEIDARIAVALAKNEIKDALREGRFFRAEGAAEGIARLLWRCPVCLAADTLAGRGDEISCSHCGGRWALDGNLRVRPLNVSHRLHAAEIGDLKDWHDWQVASLPELMVEESGGGTALRSPGIVMGRREGDRLRRLGRGELSLRGGELVFETGTARLCLDPTAIRGFVDNFNAFSEFDHRGARWRIEFHGRNAAKWIYALRRLSREGRDPRRGAAA